MNEWPFADPPNFTAFTTLAVMDRREPILLVCHDVDDGAWQFIGAPWEQDDLIIVCLEHALARDPSVAELADLPRGWGAKRSGEGEPWRRFELPPDEDTEEPDTPAA